MLRITPQYGAEQAVNYHRHHLTKGDYFTSNGEEPGIWGGKLAERLELSGHVTDVAWKNLCHNRLPDGSGPLTPATRPHRRVSFDFTFNCPKSVSVAQAMTPHGEFIRNACREAVRETMLLIEQDAQTRVRIGGAKTDRATGNLLWAEFMHTTSRPVDGIPYPHLHMHVIAINATYDPVEARIKAAQFGALKRDGPFYQAQFHHRLAVKLKAGGHGIRQSPTGWELAGYTDEMIRAFSERHERIMREAHARGSTHPEDRKRIAVKTRESKRSAKSEPEIRQAWEELAAKVGLPRDRVPGDGSAGLTEHEAVRLALEHHLARRSVAPERLVLATAIRLATGSAELDSVNHAWLKRPSVVRIQKDDRTWVTTKGVIAEELEIMDFARSGRGQCRPWVPLKVEATEGRAPEPVSPMDQLLASRDRVTLIRGVAGAGKTTMMKEAIPKIEATGQKVVVLAPGVDASRRQLREEGFADANTVAAFLQPGPLQAKAKNGVIWVDEAGQLTQRDAVQLTRAARELNARIIKMGDPRQHRSVPTGQVMTLLEKEAGCKPIVLNRIRRQVDPQWRNMVKDLSEGKVLSAWARLEKLKAIREIKREDHRLSALTKDYTAIRGAGQSVMVIVPTHEQGNRVAETLRGQLRAEYRIAGPDQTFNRLEKVDWTEAQARQAGNYQKGLTVQFINPGGGFRRGTRGEVSRIDASDGSVWITTTKGERRLPLDQAQNFQVYKSDTVTIAAGETLRITQGVQLKDGKELFAGRLVTVGGLDADGSVKLLSGEILPKTFGHWAQGYTLTSLRSQGPTTDVTLLYEPKAALGAASAEQFYVSLSRARHKTIVYTDDAAALKLAVQKQRQEPHALTLLRQSQQAMINRQRGEEHEMARSLVQLPPIQRAAIDRRQPQIVRERGRGR